MGVTEQCVILLVLFIVFLPASDGMETICCVSVTQHAQQVHVASMKSMLSDVCV